MIESRNLFFRNDKHDCKVLSRFRFYINKMKNFRIEMKLSFKKIHFVEGFPEALFNLCDTLLLDAQNSTFTLSL